MSDSDWVFLHFISQIIVPLHSATPNCSVYLYSHEFWFCCVADCLLHKKGNSLKRSRRWSQEESYSIISATFILLYFLLFCLTELSIKLNIFQEDGNLIQMVNLHSSKSWSTVARGIPGRCPRQCRDRWNLQDKYCLVASHFYRDANGLAWPLLLV